MPHAALLSTLLFLLPPALADATASELERRTLAAVNVERARHQLPPLHPLPELDRLARRHSAYLFERGELSHQDAAGRTVGQRLEAAGLPFRRAGENVAMNDNADDLAARAVAGWLRSPGHRANILDPGFSHVGTGVYGRDGRYYFTQIFYTPRP